MAGRASGGRWPLWWYCGGGVGSGGSVAVYAATQAQEKDESLGAVQYSRKETSLLSHAAKMRRV